MFMSMPETSASNILLRRAQRLRKLTGNPNLKSQGEIDQGNLSFSKLAADQLWKPIEICLKDPAVFFTNLYTSLIYGTLPHRFFLLSVPRLCSLSQEHQRKRLSFPALTVPNLSCPFVH
jgi:hypothetical protein